ncbi:MAG: carbohydrate-binding domain-containing protein, partial [Oscillospiraceae bacterium]|nr:carbohydrate-binding domain-containing protein [Oscillospiraceae bacterium]
MKKNKLMVMAAVLVLTMSVTLSSCGNALSTGNTDTYTEENTVAGKTESKHSETLETEDASDTATAKNTDSENELFTERDLTQTADLSEAVTLTVSDGKTVTISEAGVYVLTGSAENACVVVDAEDDDKVQIVLDGVSIVNDSQPCILVENADKVFLTSAEGSENTLTVTGTFGDEDAVIYSKDDLVLNGLGTVTISSTEDGVCSNDDLKLTGGTWNITASDTALKAHDSLCVYDGTYTVKAGNDGLHAEDSDDDTAGSIVIQGGTFNIQAGDDGVHATTSVTVYGGTLTISAAEGIEATQVIINDGTVSVKATDDGINAGRKSSSLSVKIEINGGDISVSMGAGDTDAIDSNGDLVITGGTIDITAQSPFDYDGQCSYTGGTIIVNGQETNSITNQMMGGGMMGGQGGQFGG